MAYPVPLLYNDDRNARRDYDYMKSIYPDTAKRVLPYMEEECDRMEYDGSMMYDEYPDRLQLRLMCRRIYDKAEKEEENLYYYHSICWSSSGICVLIFRRSVILPATLYLIGITSVPLPP